MQKVSSAPNEVSASREKLAGKYLTFALANEAYGIPVLKVREIITMLHITTVPQMPPYVKGVINLRGKVIPVIDLRTKLGLPEAEITESNCIVVVQIGINTNDLKHIGLIVDAVDEVANVSVEDSEPAPDFGGSIHVDYILGMAKVKNDVKSLLDIDKVVAADEIKSATDLF